LLVKKSLVQILVEYLFIGIYRPYNFKVWGQVNTPYTLAPQ
jgi:hypothetical protein